jgi:hypothetical protein
VEPDEIGPSYSNGQSAPESDTFYLLCIHIYLDQPNACITSARQCVR